MATQVSILPQPQAAAAATAPAATSRPPVPAGLSADALRARCARPLAASNMYRGLASAGLQYTGAFQAVRAVHTSTDGSEVAGRVAQPAARPWSDGYFVHPASLDCMLQLGAVVAGPAGSGTQGGTFVPAALACFVLPPAGFSSSSASDSDDALVCYGRDASPAARATGARAPTSTLRDHRMSDTSGRIICVVEGLEARRVGGAGPGAVSGVGSSSHAGSSPDGADVLYEAVWVAAEAAADGDDALDAAHALPSALQLRPSLGAVPAAAASIAALQQQGEAGGIGRLHMQLCRAGSGADGWSGGGPGRAQAQAGLAALVRTYHAEHPGTAVRVATADALQLPGLVGPSLELQPPLQQQQQQRQGATAGAASDGYGLAQASGVRYRALLLPSAAAASCPGPHQLQPLPRGSLGSLVPVPLDASAPCPPGTVLLKVTAVGLNFRCVRGCSARRCEWIPGEGRVHPSPVLTVGLGI